MHNFQCPNAARRITAGSALRHAQRGMQRAILLAVLFAAASPAWAAVPWHPNLATARAAARVSQRPVLAVFTARWSRVADTLDTTTFASPEVQAVLSSGFEPVRIDVDGQPDLARTLGITHVPSACILGPDDVPLATFEVTGSAPEFVSAALEAVRKAAAAPTAAVATDGGTGDAGSIAVVTGKVRQLTEFASAPGVPTSSAVATDALGAPRLPATPPAWPAEPSTGPPTSAAATPLQARPSIEPAAPNAGSSWLGAAPATPRTAPAAAPAPTPVEPPATPQSSFMAALQRPLSIFSRTDAGADQPAPAAPAAPAPPPTMPPARPQFPSFFGAAPAPAAPAAPTSPAAAQSAAADGYGPMPVGLEGYCPVTLATKGEWAEGRAQWGARHRGRTYLFVGPAEQQAFLADPDRYAPALSGDDPVLALDGGTSRPGQRRYGVTYQSRTYLFASPETRSTFAADPSRYAARIVVAERGGATRVY